MDSPRGTVVIDAYMYSSLLVPDRGQIIIIWMILTFYVHMNVQALIHGCSDRCSDTWLCTHFRQTEDITTLSDLLSHGSYSSEKSIIRPDFSK